MSAEKYDIAIVGAGMAGASLAAEVAPYASVLLLEAEEMPGYHATGRSAAFWEECYGGPALVPLTLASGEYLRDGGFLHQRGALYIGRSQDRAKLDGFMDRFAGTGVTVERLNPQALEEKIPGLRQAWSDAIWEPACADIDVAALHQHYLKSAKSHGVTLALRARVSALQHSAAGWNIACEDGRSFRAATLVNAAGAWADPLAVLAGCRPVGIEPYRRTVAQLRIDPLASSELPLTLDISGRFYFKPEAGRLWLSPHDEVPTQPCDAAPEEMAVAEAIERLEAVVEWEVDAVERKWAGLRSFAPDRLPVYGPDSANPAFFWFAGQGGFGIQTAPAAAKLAASLLLGNEPDPLVCKIDANPYLASRFG